MFSFWRYIAEKNITLALHYNFEYQLTSPLYRIIWPYIFSLRKIFAFFRDPFLFKPKKKFFRS